MVPIRPVDAAENIRFRTFDLADGLSDRNVRAVAQDRDGYIWVGTQNGLDRFDGSTFRVFRHIDDDPHSLPDNYVMSLAATADGAVWVGTAAGGLARYDPRTDRYSAVLVGDGLRCSQVRALFVDRLGTLWASCFGEAIARLDVRSGRLVLAPFGRVAGLEGVRVLGETSAGVLLFGAQQLWHWDRDSVAPRALTLAISGVARIEPHAILATDDGELWVGLISDGLLRLHADGSLIKHYRDESLPSNEIRGLLQTRNNEIWISTNAGLAIYRRLENRFFQRKVARDDPTGPPKYPAAMLEDRNGLVWVTSRMGGLGLHDPDTRAFGLYRQRGGDQAGLPQTAVTALHAAPDGSVWLGLGDEGGLVHFSTRQGVLSQLRHDPADTASLASNDISALAVGANGALWIGHATEGLDLMSPGNIRFAHHRALPRREGGLPSDLIESLLVDRADTLWLAMDGGGIASRCHDCADFTQRLRDLGPNAPAPDGTARVVAAAADGKIWGGTLTGAVRLDPMYPERLEYFRAERPRADALRHDIVTAIHVDRQERIWIATAGGGVQQVITTSEHLTFIHPPAARDIDDVYISCMLDDVAGNLWLASSDKLRRFNPDSGRSQVMFSGQFGAACGQDKHTAYFGGGDGLLTFDPAQISPLRPVGPVRLSELWLFNVPVQPNPDQPGAVLAQRLAELESLDFNYRQSVFGFSFAAIEYRDPDSVRYRYRLKGLHDDWLPLAQGQRFVNFSHVPAGDYEFSVEASRGDSRSVAVVGIRVLPAPWRSIWAYAAYATVLLCGFAFAWSRSQARLRYERAATAAIRRSEEALRLLNEELEVRVAARTADLSATNVELATTLESLQLTQRQLVESEKMASLGALVAGVAHEINTPLGVGVTAASHLRSETEQLRKRLASGTMRRSDLDAFENTASAATDLIVRNLARAAELVRTFREVAVDESSGITRTIELGKEMHDLLTILAPALRGSRHIVRIDCPEPIHVNVPAGAVHRILTNLVTNALQHAYGSGVRGTFTLSAHREAEEVVLACCDDGVGMSEDVRQRAFEPFFTTRRSQGAMGLGLHISYNLATQILRGSIRCESAPGQGCRIEIRWRV